MKKIIAIIVMSLCAAFILVPQASAHELTAAQVQTPPNAFKVIKTKDGNYYSLYNIDGNYAAFHRAKKHAKSITIKKYVKYNGKKYKVSAIHEFNLLNRKDIKKVTIKANNLETIEEPALYKQYRKQYHKKIKIVCKDKQTRKWLNAKW